VRIECRRSGRGHPEGWRWTSRDGSATRCRTGRANVHDPAVAKRHRNEVHRTRRLGVAPCISTIRVTPGRPSSRRRKVSRDEASTVRLRSVRADVAVTWGSTQVDRSITRQDQGSLHVPSTRAGDGLRGVHFGGWGRRRCGVTSVTLHLEDRSRGLGAR